jgi:putative transposase
MVSYLCKIAGVSRNGYYEWLKAAVVRKRSHDKDEQDIVPIKEFFYKKAKKVGALQIKMHLENDKKIVMNHKKIRRLMRKYELIVIIRKANPYKKMMKATQEHRTCPNLLKLEFNQGEIGKVLLTDITISIMKMVRRPIYPVLKMLVRKKYSLTIYPLPWKWILSIKH